VVVVGERAAILRKDRRTRRVMGHDFGQYCPGQPRCVFLCIPSCVLQCVCETGDEIAIVHRLTPEVGLFLFRGKTEGEEELQGARVTLCLDPVLARAVHPNAQLGNLLHLNPIPSLAFSFANSSKRRTAVVGLLFNIDAVLASTEGGTTKRPSTGARIFSAQVNVRNGIVTGSPTLTLVTPARLPRRSPHLHLQ
jgi:hypothetical protein